MIRADLPRDGVPPLQGREARLSALDASLARGLADAEAGRVKPAADVFDRLEDKYRRLANRSA
ncbi:type II toxin-antitoxin system ParD family antitoxin [Mycobacterium sp. KBS0706]|uniref:type II toxin-antitoxin system ParD family antitoxin n=1 Tax=Mycobacterium sp. KBS0706 TaxID=2578109 RepID=UPI00110FC0C2|nr:type II toxin-antitoxin system ParD family antitoxin [Mycobacterium sp. KBS0706]TSD88712.1 type II toxin-antitoxin system ParD family antitoxin [Mycobacterium sp. KBS0706]